MEWIRILVNRCVALFRREKLDAQLDDELRAHIELAIQENLRQGMNADEARTAALRAFGGVTQAREAYRMQREVPLLGQVGRDLRFGIRQLRKSPGFALTAILTLALGIGAVTSVFSVVNAVLLRPFSFRDAGRLIVIREVEDEMRGKTAAIPDNYRHFLRLRHDSKTLEDAAIFQQFGVSVSPNGDRPHIVGALSASPNFLHVLGVQPLMGRDFVDGDAVKGASSVVLLSYAGWQAFFGGDPNVVGRTLQIGGEPVTVVGVLPAGMRFPDVALAPNFVFAATRGADQELMVYEPFVPSDHDLKTDAGGYNYKVIARLKQDVTAEQARAELETLQRAYSISAHLPDHLGISLAPLRRDVTSGISGALWMMFAAVGGVLLIACVNLANLQLARGVTAEREMAVRAALGASKTQLVMTRLMESLILALMGGVAGMALAFTDVRLLLALIPANVPRLDEVQVNLPVLVFAAFLSTGAAITFGVLPALRSLHVHPQAALQTNSIRTGSSRQGLRTRSLLVAGQVACTVVLLIVTGLMLRSFSHLMRQERGFDSGHMTLAQVDLFSPQYGDKKPDMKAKKLAFIDRTLTALGRLPGVQSVAVTSAVPMTGEMWIDLLTRPDHPLPVPERPAINVRWISPSYLAAMHVPLVAGRNLTEEDRTNPHVALISEKTAHDGFAGENPIGRKIESPIPDDEKPMTIVGVVADTKINGLKDSAAMVYAPYFAFTPWVPSFLVRSSEPSDALIPAMRRAIWDIDPQVAIPVLKSMDDQVSESVATDRFQALVLTCFGAAALLLALLGVYGVQAYSVSLRRQEFGIRIAMGSGRAALTRLVLRQAAYPVLGGVCVGLVMATAALWLIRSLLYQTPATDPLAIGGSVLLLLVAAALAAVVPARRAASVDPMQALRTE